MSGEIICQTDDAEVRAIANVVNSTHFLARDAKLRVLAYAIARLGCEEAAALVYGAAALGAPKEGKPE